jgi:hypothetical protein
MRNKKRINPTVERISKAANDDLGNRTSAACGASRPKTEGPSRIPPTISPMTRDWPALRASQPQVRVTSITAAISTKSRVTVHQLDRFFSRRYETEIADD